jgi:uncharacterized membrane protein
VSAEGTAPPATGLTKARVEALTDGIFSVAMTPLILDIRVPVLAHPAELPRELLALWPKCVAYVISFVMLGIYWVGQHNQFHLIQRTDRALLWINILFMMTICFVPFSTALLSTYPREQVAVTVYGMNLIVIGLILYGHWSYATHGHRLVNHDLGAHTVRFASRRILIGPAVFAIAIAVSFFGTTPSLFIFLCAPLIYLFPGKIDRHWSDPG